MAINDYKYNNATQAHATQDKIDASIDKNHVLSDPEVAGEGQIKKHRNTIAPLKAKKEEVRALEEGATS